MNATVLKVIEVVLGTALVALSFFVPVADKGTALTFGVALLAAGGVTHHDTGELEVLGMTLVKGTKSVDAKGKDI